MYINRESLIADYNAGLPNQKLARKHGCSVTTVRKRLIEYGIYTAKRYRKNKEPLNKPSPAQIQEWKEKAEKWDNIQKTQHGTD
jgi:uncharacterized protein YjcR